MIIAIFALLACQLAGEVLVRALHLPLPGPVVGFGLMFAFLVWQGRGVADVDAAIPEVLGRVCDTLLRNLSLLFIPAAVGIVQYLDLLRANAEAIGLTIALSTVAAMTVTVGTFRFVSRLHAFRHKTLLGDIESAAGYEDNR